MINWLNNARIAAGFAVVMLHVAAGVVMTTEPGTTPWWFGNLYDTLTRWSVPVFVMISGMLLLSDDSTESAADFYRKRMSRLVVPLLFWSVIYLAWNWLKQNVAGNEVAIESLLNTLAAGQPHYHLWFLFMLPGLYLFVPFLRIVVRHGSRQQLVLLTGLAFFIAAANALDRYLHPAPAAIFLAWFLPFIPYFFSGYLIGRSAVLKNAQAALVLVGATAVTAIGCYGVTRVATIESGVYFYDYLSISVIPMALSLQALFRNWQRPLFGDNACRQLARLTLGIYLVHPIIFESFSYFVFKPVAFNPALSIPLITLAVYAVSFAVVWLMSKLPLLARTVV